MAKEKPTSWDVGCTCKFEEKEPSAEIHCYGFSDKENPDKPVAKTKLERDTDDTLNVCTSLLWSDRRAEVLELIGMKDDYSIYTNEYIFRSFVDSCVSVDALFTFRDYQNEEGTTKTPYKGTGTAALQTAVHIIKKYNTKLGEEGADLKVKYIVLHAAASPVSGSEGLLGLYRHLGFVCVNSIKSLWNEDNLPLVQSMGGYGASWAWINKDYAPNTGPQWQIFQKYYDAFTVLKRQFEEGRAISKELELLNFIGELQVPEQQQAVIALAYQPFCIAKLDTLCAMLDKKVKIKLTQCTNDRECFNETCDSCYKVQKKDDDF